MKILFLLYVAVGGSTWSDILKAAEEMGDLPRSVEAWKQMSREKIKEEIYKISEQHPTWKAERIRREFALRFPNERNQPSANKIQKLVYYKSLDGGKTGANAQRKYHDLSFPERKRYSEMAREAVQRAIAQAPQNADRRSIVESAWKMFHDESNGVTMKIASFDNIYMELLPANERHKAASRIGRMTADEKRVAVYGIWDEHPQWSIRQVAFEFQKRYPNEPEPPSYESVRNYKLYQDFQGGSELKKWADMSRDDQRKYSVLGREKAAEVARRMPTHPRSEVLKVMLDEIYAEHGIRIRPETARQWIPKKTN